MKAGKVELQTLLPIKHRFDASYHLSEGAVVKRIIQNSPYPLLTVGDVSDRIFYGNRARRVYVKNRTNGIPFLSSSDILQADLENVKLASKKYMPGLEDMKLQKGWTLISRSGTIGNCAFATAKHAQKLASEDVIRLVPNNILRGGLVYSYLASEYGHTLLTQGTFGAVIQHIEPSFIESLPIPNFPISFQTEVDDLIQESARLREEATDALEEAHRLIVENVPVQIEKKSHRVSIQSIRESHNQRFEGFYYTSENRSLYEAVTSLPNCTKLANCTEKIFRPGIFKRKYVNNNGITFLGGADILRAIPGSEKQLAKSQVAQMPELMTKEGWVLVTCGGTIGNTVYVDSQLAQCAVSQHVLRIVPNGNLPAGYLYAFLSSQIGFKLINMFTSGSVIPQIEPHHLELVPVPVFDGNLEKRINSLVNLYVKNTEKSKSNELRAIQMVEQEISKWNN